MIKAPDLSIADRRGTIGTAKTLCVLVTIFIFFCFTVNAQTLYFECPDESTTLPESGEMIFKPWDIVANDRGTYTRVKTLPQNLRADAVHRLAAADHWLISLAEYTELPPDSNVSGSDFYDRREVYLWDGDETLSAYPPYEGAREQIPFDRNVDAVFVDSAGAVVVSFDTETQIGSVSYEPADLVRYNTAASSFDIVPYFDASAAGISNSSNLIAAHLRGRLLVFSLDVASRVKSSMFRPGELISWDGNTLAVFDSQPGWPSDRSRQVNALSFPPSRKAPAAQSASASSPGLQRAEEDAGSTERTTIATVQEDGTGNRK